MTQGIDYGMGLANIDNETGIRFGVISPHSVNGDSLQCIYDNGENLTHAAAIAEAKERITFALRNVFNGLGMLPYDYRNGDRTPKADAYLAPIVDAVWDDVEQDFNDHYEEDSDTYRYSEDGYVLETSSLGIYVIRSPFYTFAAFCSPCCPGAGNLDSPRLTAESGVKTYCLGPDWFDNDECTMPYTAFNVSDDTEVTS
jgi:hypothetical protein